MKRAWLASPRLRWADELDFIGPRVRTSVVGWALLALGLVAVMHSADQVDRSEQALSEAQATLRRLARAGHQDALRQKVAAQALAPAGQGRRGREAGAPAMAASPDGAPTLTPAGWQHAAQLALWLAYPWQATLDHVDEASVREHAVLTAFSLDLSTLGSAPGAGPEWKLQAAVQSDVNALQWVQALGPQASLRSREALDAPFTTTRGTYAWRVDAQLREGRP